MRNPTRVEGRRALHIQPAGSRTATTRAIVRRICLLALSIFAVVTVAILTAGCGGTSEVGDAGTISSTVPTPTTTTESANETTTSLSDSVPSTVPSDTVSTTTTLRKTTMTINVYFCRQEKICPASRVIPYTKEVGAAAMKALLEGPTQAEKEADVVTNIPEGTTFLGLTIENGVATVDLSKEYSSGGGSLSMMMRLAQVVFTLTQFPTVEGVTFKLDGKPIDVLGGEGIIIDHPMTRADYEDLSPAILIESPTICDKVSSPVRITGTANVFEAVFRINIVDYDGLILADEKVTASAGTGTRGTFDVTMRFKLRQPGPGYLIAFSNSPRDGSQINVVEIPIELE